MSPQHLLRETQRTAGDENLVLWHNTLIEKGKELKTAQTVSPPIPPLTDLSPVKYTL